MKQVSTFKKLNMWETFATLILLFMIESNSSSIEGKVFGTSGDVPENLFRFMVSIQLKHNRLHVCGGALVSRRNVLTAAHCNDQRYLQKVTKSENYNLGVVVGSHKINPGGEWYNVLHSINHSGYRNGTIFSPADITVLVIREKIIMSRSVTYYSPDFDEKIRGVVAGWGLGRRVGPIDQALRWIPVDVVNNTFCEAAYNISLDCHYFCGTSNNTVECLVEGDDGGVFTDIVDNIKYAGIVSNVLYRSRFIVFINIHKYLMYILGATIKTLKDDPGNPIDKFDHIYRAKFPQYINSD